MKKIVFGLALLMASLSFSTHAAELDDVTAKIKKTYPSLSIKNVTYLPSINLYEVRLQGNNQLTYTNKDVSFFLVSGEIVDPKTKQNVSADRSMTNIVKFVNELDYKKAINIKYGTGERKIVIFTDPDCPFCKTTDREIHNNLTNSNITVSYFFNPLNIQGHEQAPLKAAKIWCAPNKEQAFKDWMLNGVLPNNPGTCPNPVAETKKLSTEMGFNSTPTIIFDNGHIARQSLSAEQITKVFEAKKPITNPK